MLCAAAVDLFGLVSSSLTPVLLAGASLSLDVLAEPLLPVLGASAVASLAGRKRGRPRKFDEPSRAVTLTLPESVIERLGQINQDLSVAVADLVAPRPAPSPRAPAELTVFGRRAVITVTPRRGLERRIGVELIPVSDGRALISFEQARSAADLELLLADALEDKSLDEGERQLFESISALLKEARRSTSVALVRRNIIVLEHSARRKGRSRRR